MIAWSSTRHDAVDAIGDLRPAHRAERFDWFYRLRHAASSSRSRRQSDRPPLDRSSTLAVVPVKGKVLKFVAWIDHPDGDANPPHVGVGRLEARCTKATEAKRAVVHRYSGDARQDAHGDRDVDRSDVAAERPGGSDRRVGWVYRSGMAFGNSSFPTVSAPDSARIVS